LRHRFLISCNSGVGPGLRPSEGLRDCRGQRGCDRGVALTQFFARGARQVPDGGDWFEKTTTFADRENNDPLAPVRKELRAAKAPESRMVGVERESNNWYKNQEKKRSMFGRTLNPLTGYAPACVCVSMRGSSVGAPFLCLAPCSHRAALPRRRRCPAAALVTACRPSKEAAANHPRKQLCTALPAWACAGAKAHACCCGDVMQRRQFAGSAAPSGSCCASLNRRALQGTAGH